MDRCFTLLLLLPLSAGQWWGLDRDMERHWNRRDPFMNRYRAPEIINRGPRFIVVAPDLLRADSQENIYVEGSSLSAPVSVSISIWDFDKSQELLRVPAFTLGLEPGNHTLQSIQGYHEVSRVMMVSFQHGYIFVQTDKPIYNPGTP
ncbi:hypothetical protein CRUP_009088, partial [Coryphaenoides rupestris]